MENNLFLSDFYILSIAFGRIFGCVVQGPVRDVSRSGPAARTRTGFLFVSYFNWPRVTISWSPGDHL